MRWDDYLFDAGSLLLSEDDREQHIQLSPRAGVAASEYGRSTNADSATIERAFLILCDVRAKITARPDERHDPEWAVERQLGELLRAFPTSVVIGALGRRFADPINPLEAQVITRIFKTVGRQDPEFGARLGSSEVDRLIRRNVDRRTVQSSLAAYPLDGSDGVRRLVRIKRWPSFCGFFASWVWEH